MSAPRSNHNVMAASSASETTFLDNLTLKGGKYKVLADLVKGNKEIHLKFFEDEGFVCVCCHIDRKLIAWANTPFKFPRGFVVDITTPTDPKFRGFLPKFSNDARSQTIVAGEYEGVTKAIITPKASGFLINIIVTKGKFRLINKNSYGTAFTEKANEIFEEWVVAHEKQAKALKLKCEMDGLTLSAEFMHTEDKMHGYVAKKNCFAVTCISSGKDDSDDSEAALQYFSFAEKDALCREFDLPYFPSWVVGGEGEVDGGGDDLLGEEDGNDVAIFMERFNQIRDNMTYRTFDLLMATKATILDPGNFDHLANIGDTLEGAIMFCTMADGTQMIKKVKLPRYTCCTMIYRQLLGSPLNKSLIRKIRKGVEAWTVSEEGYNKWVTITLGAFSLSGRIDDPETFIDNGNHASTWLKALERPLTVEEFLVKHGIGTRPQLLLVAIVGPVGYGKSSLGTQVAKIVRRGHHIDGDKLDLGSEAEVLRLGKERTPYTLYKIAEAWMDNKVPIISTGGGVLDKVETFVATMFPKHELNLITIVPSNYHRTYNTWKVDDVVTRRITAGVWTLPPGQAMPKFIAKIQKLSTGNVRFAEKLSEMADVTFTYGNLCPETAAIYNTIPILEYTSKIKANVPTSLVYQQHRILTTCPLVPKYGHITLEFVDGTAAGAGGYEAAARSGGVTTKNKTDIVNCEGEVDAILLTIKNKKGCQLVVVPDNKVVRVVDDDNNSKTHMTVNAGPHAPVKMGDVAASFLKGDTEVMVDDVMYSLSRGKQVKTKLKLCGVFFL